MSVVLLDVPMSLSVCKRLKHYWIQFGTFTDEGNLVWGTVHCRRCSATDEDQSPLFQRCM